MTQTIKGIVAIIMLLSTGATGAKAQEARSFYELSLKPQTVSVRRDNGGNIAQYVVLEETYRADQSMVEFEGQCDSACTLLLALAPEQICLKSGAFFRFHAPKASSVNTERFAADIIMRKYPFWVRDWITTQGGLKPQLVTMDYQYASLFVQSCSATIY